MDRHKTTNTKHQHHTASLEKMVTQEEQSRRRKSGEAHMEAVANDAHKTLLDPKALSKKPERTQTPLPSRYTLELDWESDDDEDEATLKRETDPPVSSARAPKEQLDCPPGYVVLPPMDITRQCGPFRAVQRPTCAGCRSSSHRLNICMKASQSEGLMNGCPWCNTLEHSLTNCPDTKHDLAMQLEFIQMRANMPSFQPTQDWVDVVRAAIADGHKPPTAFLGRLRKTDVNLPVHKNDKTQQEAGSTFIANLETQFRRPGFNKVVNSPFIAVHRHSKGNIACAIGQRYLFASFFLGRKQPHLDQSLSMRIEDDLFSEGAQAKMDLFKTVQARGLAIPWRDRKDNRAFFASNHVLALGTGIHCRLISSRHIPHHGTPYDHDGKEEVTQKLQVPFNQKRLPMGETPLQNTDSQYSERNDRRARHERDGGSFEYRDLQVRTRRKAEYPSNPGKKSQSTCIRVRAQERDVTPHCGGFRHRFQVRIRDLSPIEDEPESKDDHVLPSGQTENPSVAGKTKATWMSQEEANAAVFCLGPLDAIR
ncbi:hypothetical protein FCOIX_6251 [Fusarium coicis]|nr:hypothetical protein FCOIX_6251 [Fusarium coicis]